MKIRCWGARGSIPVSGREYVKYGGDTTCIEIRDASDEVIVVDAGSGIRRLGNKILGEKRTDISMIFTHSHWDHILGFPFFKPIYSKNNRMHLYGCKRHQGNIKMMLSRVMLPPYFPVPYELVQAELTYNSLCDTTQVHGIEVTPITLSHPNMGQGYKFEENGKSFVFLTDNELSYGHRGGRSFDEYVEFAQGADLLFHDAEYTAPEYERLTKGWGHSTYVDALELAIRAGVKKFGLFHLNQDRPDSGVDAMVADCRRILEQRGVAMECFAASQEMEFDL